MREHGEEGIVERAKHALGHRRSVHTETRVNRADDKIELREQIRVVVETTVGEDVGLDALEHTKARSACVQLVDLLELRSTLSRERPDA